MSAVTRPYRYALQRVLLEGEERADRTGVGTLSVFGHQSTYDLREGFPILTEKKIHFKSVVEELLWFLSGSTDVKDLQARGVRIWNEWATAEECAKFGREAGDLGPTYGKQWRDFGGVDQIAQAIELLKKDPYSRRNIVTAWNPPDVPKVTLAPCHTLFQLYVSNDELSLHLYQRSADIFLGVPFNVASYALLVHMISAVCELRPGKLVVSYGDLHLYNNHREQAAILLDREAVFEKKTPRLQCYANGYSLNQFGMDNGTIVLEEYDPHPAIKAEVAV